MIQKLKSKDGKPAGILIALVNPTKPHELLIGYAACHPHKEKQYCRGEARRLAVKRADVLSTRLGHWRDRKVIKNQPTDCTWPWNVLAALPNFVQRCTRYYKDKTLVPWAQSILDDPPQPTR